MIKKILVSQPQPSSEKSPYFDIANDFGVELVFRPFIKVEGLTAKEFRKQKISILDYSAIVFTSRHAIDNFFNLSKELRVSIPETMKYFCVTEQIALYIQKYVQYRKRKIFFGTTLKETATQGMHHVSHRQQRLHAGRSRSIRLRHDDIFQPDRSALAREKLPKLQARKNKDSSLRTVNSKRSSRQQTETRH